MSLGLESAGQRYGLGLYQGFVDFDLLGEEFYVMFSGYIGSTGYSNMTWNLRIGGTYLEATTDPEGTPDGDLVVIGTVSPSAFQTFSTKALVTNIWTGVQHVKLTGQKPGGGCFAIGPALVFLPVL